MRAERREGTLRISWNPARLWRAYLTEAKYESVRMLRAPAFAIPFLGLPVALYLLFAVLLFGDAFRSDPKKSAHPRVNSAPKRR